GRARAARAKHGRPRHRGSAPAEVYGARYPEADDPRGPGARGRVSHAKGRRYLLGHPASPARGAGDRGRFAAGQQNETTFQAERSYAAGERGPPARYSDPERQAPGSGRAPETGAGAV